MRNNFITTFLCLLITSSALAQNSTRLKGEENAQYGRNCACDLSFLGLSTTNQRIQIDFSIPFGGVVELQLFDANGKRIWHNTYAREEGAHSIPLNRSAFRPGEPYSFRLKYKTSEYRGEVIL